MKKRPPTQRSYFVDEAGDAVLFDAHGRPIVGAEGCSRFFILGPADIPDPLALRHDLDHLRAWLLADSSRRGHICPVGSAQCRNQTISRTGQESSGYLLPS